MNDIDQFVKELSETEAKIEKEKEFIASTKEDAVKQITRFKALADEALAQAEKIADKYGISFYWESPRNVLTYNPQKQSEDGFNSSDDYYEEPGWSSSSDYC